MTPRRSRLLPLASCLAISSASACALDEGGRSECEGAKCDDRLEAPDEDIEDSACDGAIFDLSGRRNEKVVGRLGDPIARALQNSESCPTSFGELIAILDEETGTDCALRTRVISEVASTVAEFGSVAEAKRLADYRTVTNRQCDGDTSFSVLFSQFGMGSDSSAPDDYEAISFDEVEGVFNYYKLHGDGTFAWFGNSRDMLDGPGQQVTINETTTSEVNCARCHVGGGLIMKELPAPWLHWHQAPLAGASDLVQANADVFGQLTSGANLEGIVKAGNRSWNNERIAHIRKTGTARDLLRPIFCTQEINIDSSGTRTQSLADEEISFVSINAGASEYQAVRDELNQTMITGASGSTGSDTAQGNTFPIRAEIDIDYSNKLIDEKLIDISTRDAILMVDFTRPVFSDDRCDLLQFVPALPLTNKSGLPGKIRNGLIDNIGPSATSAARELRRNLINFKANADALFETLDAFDEICGARDGEEATRDVMTFNSLMRSRARELEIMEFAGSLAFDKFQPGPESSSSLNAKTRISPKSCELVTRFTGVATAVDDE